MEDLQGLLEKINREGVEKAKKNASEIIAAARAEAEALLKNAREEAARVTAEGEKNAAAYAERAKETLAQASRDIVLKIERAVTDSLDKLLVKSVDKALADEATGVQLVKEAIAGMTGGGEIKCGEKLAQALAAQLAALGSFTVVTDDFQGTGFTVKVDGGRVEHSFTGEVIAAELKKRLRPDLAKLV